MIIKMSRKQQYCIYTYSECLKPKTHHESTRV